MKEEIGDSIEKALSFEFRQYVKDTENPYGDGFVSDKILLHIKEVLRQGIDLKKSFYNIQSVEE